MTAEIIAWTSLCALGCALAGYPVLLYVVCALKGNRMGDRKGELPRSVSIVVCVFNGEGMVRRRIENLLTQTELPAECEIVLVSDGSGDGTVREARAALANAGGVRGRVVEYESNRGKAVVLNEIIPGCSGEIVVLCDVRQEFAADAVHRLLCRFSDESVGAVSGALVFRNAGSAAGAGVASYWDFEKTLRKLESCVDSTCGCSGAIYAIRRSLFRPIEEDTVLDDVAIPMRIVEAGKRVVFEESAVAWDSPAVSYEDERSRKMRTLAGNIQLVKLYPSWLNPMRNRLAFQFAGHKLMRLLNPWLMAVLFASSCFAARANLFWQIVLGGQLLFYFLAIIGMTMSKRTAPVILSAPAAFVKLHIWAIEALFMFLSGKLDVRWRREDA
jgi:cellulose synthase/poly-beta-1,6-N-acetylglucosamine synthase-like glycosyltransferase